MSNSNLAVWHANRRYLPLYSYHHKGEIKLNLWLLLHKWFMFFCYSRLVLESLLKLLVFLIRVNLFLFFSLIFENLFFSRSSRQGSNKSDRRTGDPDLEKVVMAQKFIRKIKGKMSKGKGTPGFQWQRPNAIPERIPPAWACQAPRRSPSSWSSPPWWPSPQASMRSPWGTFPSSGLSVRTSPRRQLPQGVSSRWSWWRTWGHSWWNTSRWCLFVPSSAAYQRSARVVFSIPRREWEFLRFNLVHRDETENSWRLLSGFETRQRKNFLQSRASRRDRDLLS